MIAQRLFTLVSRLICSRWVRDYAEHHGPCEDSYTARLGVLLPASEPLLRPEL